MKKHSLIILFLFLLSACKKEKQLPPLTHEGKNTLSVKIDKDVHSFSEPLAWGPFPDGVSFSIQSDSVADIFAQNSSISLSLRFKYMGQTGTYPLSWEETSCKVGDSYYVPDSLNPGSITIMYASAAVVAGTFQFTGFYADPVYHYKYNKTFTGNFDFSR